MTGIARQNDTVTASDVHVLPNGSYTAAPFNGLLTVDLATSVFVNSKPVALSDSVATNTPPHPPPIVASNRGTVIAVRPITIGGRPVACLGDHVRTCNDPVDIPIGQISSASENVSIGGA